MEPQQQRQKNREDDIVQWRDMKVEGKIQFVEENCKHCVQFTSHFVFCVLETSFAFEITLWRILGEFSYGFELRNEDFVDVRAIFLEIYVLLIDFWQFMHTFDKHYLWNLILIHQKDNGFLVFEFFNCRKFSISKIFVYISTWRFYPSNLA